MSKQSLEDEVWSALNDYPTDAEENAMLKASTLKIADTTIVRCQGPILVGEDLAALRSAVTKDCSAKLVVLDMAGVRRIDAGGLGVLLGLREWARRNSTQFKLMNVRPKVERVIKVARLEYVFEFWTVRDMFDLIHLSHVANAVGACSLWFAGKAAYDPSVA
jgi:anti-anti-sigma factor